MKKIFKLLLLIIMIGINGCYKDEAIENMKKSKIPLKEVSNYTFEQLAKNLQNPKWTIKEGKEKDSLKDIEVILTGTYKIKNQEKPINIKIIGYELFSNGKYIKLNNSLIPKIEYIINIPFKDTTIKFIDSAMIDTCIKNGKEKDISYCIKGLNQTINHIMKK